MIEKSKTTRHFVKTSAAGQRPSTLADRYSPSAQTVLLTGIQAIGRLLAEQHARDARAGLSTSTFISGYRGSPLGGLDKALAAIVGLKETHGVHFVPGLNEELAATAVWGSQTVLPGQRLCGDGVIGVWYGKAPGVDRAGDAIRHGNLAGAHPKGGVLVLAGDDPAAKSSTLPSASERTLAALGLPVLYPRSSEEIITLGLYGIALSRASGLWVGMKISTDVADGFWSMTHDFSALNITIPQINWRGLPWRHVQPRAATLPWSRDAEEQMVGPRWDMVGRFAALNPLDRLEVDPPNARIGIAAAGKTYSDLLEALHKLGLSNRRLREAGIRLLRIGLIHPLTPGVIREFAAGLQTVIVVEEKRAFIETQMRELLYGRDAPTIVGKCDAQGHELMPAYGALTAQAITRALHRVLTPVLQLHDLEVHPDSPTELAHHRTSYYCSGCPHNRSTMVIEGSWAGGGIGCHAMALRMPATASRMTGITQMGGEGAQWIGQSPFTTTHHLFQNMGDGTYFHSGQLALQACVAAGVNITYKLLYNSAVAMTGGQHVDAALPVPALARKLIAEGVSRIIICADDPVRYDNGGEISPQVSLWHRDRVEEAQRLLRDISGVTVLIYDQYCAAESRRLRKRGQAPVRTRRLIVNELVCEGCGDCGTKSNCLSVQPVMTEFGRKTRIDQSSCNLDYSCLDGDCPSFMSAELAPPARGPASAARAAASSAPVSSAAAAQSAQSAPVPPEPARPCIEGTYDILMAGIGGTGVVTVNFILGMAASSEGFEVAGLDQTGLSQKAGPVASHLRLARANAVIFANSVGTGGADCYLAFDALVGAERETLSLLNSRRTKAIVSTSRTPTGPEVRDLDARAPETSVLVERIRSASAACALLDSLGLAQELFGSTAPANIMMLGAAYQMGALPMRSDSIEAAIIANGVGVDLNLMAFRWGRALQHDPAMLPRREAVGMLGGDEFLAQRSLAGETRRLAGIRAAHLAAYQSTRLANRYLDVLEVAWSAERRLGARTEFTQAVARGLHRLMAYKDEYEVARLLTAPSTEAQLASSMGKIKNLRFHLQPQFLRVLGLKRKISLSARWRPLLMVLSACRIFRGTYFDPFGWMAVRRLERSLARAYQSLIESLAETLSVENYDIATQAADAAELVRGYEQIKVTNTQRFVDRLASLRLPGISLEPLYRLPGITMNTPIDGRLS